MQLSSEAISTLQEVRGPVNYEAMKLSLAPALDSVNTEHLRLLQEEDALRAQLDAKLTEVQAASTKVQRYHSTMEELTTLSQGVQG